MSDLKLRYLDRGATLASALMPGETVLWSQAPEFGESLFYWRNKIGWWAAAWTVGWTYVAARQIGYGSSVLAIAIPIALVVAGLAALVGVKSIVKRLGKRIYTITSERIIESDDDGCHLRYIWRSDVDEIAWLPGRSASSGSLIVTAGEIDGPDGRFPFKMRLLGITNIDLARRAIDPEETWQT